MAIYARALSAQESEEVGRGLRSPDGTWSRHCQIVASSSQRTRASDIAVVLGLHVESVRRILRAFNASGLDGIRSRKHPGPEPLERRMTPEALEDLQEMLRQSPQAYDVSRPVWSMATLAEVAWKQGVLPERVRPERLRRMLVRLGYTWKQVKRWIVSPDPDYAVKRGDAIN